MPPVSATDGTLVLGQAAIDHAEKATAASPVPVRPALVLIHPVMPDIGEPRYLDKQCLIVGRDGDADFQVARGSVSRRHAELRRTPSGEWLLADMGSTNGTMVNQELVEDTYLEDGDHVQFGDAVFKFVCGSSMAYHKKVFQLTTLDGLTSVAGHRHFFSKLEKRVGKARTQERSMAVLFMDVDYFSALNDERGILCGDSVLRDIAWRIRQSVRSQDFVGRIDGDAFGVLLPGTELDEAIDMAKQIRQVIAGEDFSFEGEEFDLTMSIGVAASHRGEQSAKELIGEVKKQLKSAKENGRNCVAPL